MSAHLGQVRATDIGPLRDRQPQAVERWFRDYADAVYTFAYYRVGRDPDLATEVVQETFTTALRRIEEYDPQRGVMLAWLTCCCRNSIRKVLHEKHHGEALADFWEEIDGRLMAAYRDIATAPLPEEILDKRETNELVQLTLASLPVNYQQVLRDHYFEKKCLKYIANSQGMSEGAIKSLMHRARLAFKTAFLTLADAVYVEHPANGGAA